ncbi:Xyloglucanase [Ceratocystis platani]|uniref:Xyloglucanase n=1 Tax=Ceratocystis fimbriata f. sp. platani TaxID=88771 RepID=A0A0F8CR49_CERFI|nr:Xyloglucanase [Ceratocystis platani]
MGLFKSLTALVAAAVPIQAVASDWKNVKIGGGGGFVPSVVYHPTVPGLAYARTDMGGLYRMNADDTWTILTDGLAFDDTWNRWGIDALAVDAQDPNKVYAAVGMYTNSWDPNNGAIIRSSDKGSTWEVTELSFKVGGNMPGRGMGERLAVDPINSDVLYFGARSGKGLWKSTDGGKTFAQVTSFTNTGPFATNPSDTSGYSSDPQGVTFVTFDTTSAALSGTTSRIFVGTADNSTTGASVWESKDAGETWAAVAGQPTKYFPHKCRISPEENAMYLSYSDGTGPYDGSMGGVHRYDLKANTWKDITPASGSDLYFGFGGLAVDMKKPGTIMVATLNSWTPDAQIFRSTDSGTTWSKLWEITTYPERNMHFTQDFSNAPWMELFLKNDTKKIGWMIESLEIDPTDSDHWTYGTGLTLFGGRDLTKWDTEKMVKIEIKADGIEEVAVLDMASIPGGTELLAAVSDNDGFTYPTFADLNTSPKTMWDPKYPSSSSVDYAGTVPNTVVRTGNTAGTNQVSISTDGGVTWTLNSASGTTAAGGSIAISADAKAMVWSTANSGVLHSDGTSTFAAVSSLPSSAVIASDKQDGKYFYAGSEGAFYVSSDAGLNFAKGAALGSATAIRSIAAHPSTAGTVYVSTDVGVFASTDFGKTFSTLGEGVLSDAHSISLGKGTSGFNIYVIAKGAASEKVYSSSDNGATWTDVQGDIQGFGAMGGCFLAGSNNEANVVYVGTNGRGIFYKSIGGGESAPPASSATASATATATTTATTTPTSTGVKAAAATTGKPATYGKADGVKVAAASDPTTTAASAYARCGGPEQNAPSTCVTGYTCKKMNDYYYQCV